MTFLIGPEAHQVFFKVLIKIFFFNFFIYFKATDEELSPREAYQFVIPGIFIKKIE